MSERLQKILANLGLGSRREIERWMVDGRITVNGKPAELGVRVGMRDQVCIDGKSVELTQDKIMTRVLMYNKPEGIICTRHDPQGRPNVFESLPRIKNARWINIGRLDINTSGLLLFTNDGELANKLMHPAQQCPREYAVRVLGRVDADMLKRLTHGVKLEDGLARFEDIVESGGDGANRWYHVVVVEGRNRLVRRLWESQGVTVSRLKRVRFGPIFLPSSVHQGKYVELNDKLINELKMQAGISPVRS